ncbi:MAG: hypothetical protein LZF61_10290 [Nitrosomonas sp.]|nr:MAG: hypothetical protein LZF61_10290 [Nitrosomonas sp.]
MNANPVLTFKCRSSGRLAALLCVMHLVAFGLLWPLAVSFWVKVAITVLLILSLIHYLRQDALLTSSAAVAAVTLTANMTCVITTRAGAVINGNLLASTVVTPYLTVIFYRPEGKWLSRSIVILSDSLDVEVFRKLRIWLQWRWKARVKH